MTNKNKKMFKEFDKEKYVVSGIRYWLLRLNPRWKYLKRLGVFIKNDK
jgi:hypothetical protein